MDIWKPSESVARASAAKPKFSLADLKPEVLRLSQGQLEYALFVFVANRLSESKDCNEHLAQYVLAHQILRFMLGDQWVEQHIFDHEEVSRMYKPGREFLKSEASDSGERLRHQHRVITLAECLYNLQRISGIEHRVASLEKDSLQSAFGELICARIIAAPALKMLFVKPTGHTGSDYDAEFTTAKGRVICCEFKAKDENTEFSPKAVANGIEQARKQLPAGRPGAVFMTIPEHWSAQSGAKAVVDKAIRWKFANSGRLLAVFVAWETWMTTGDGAYIEARFDATINKRSRYYEHDIEDSQKWFGSHLSADWLQLPVFVTKWIHVMQKFIREKLANET